MPNAIWDVEHRLLKENWAFPQIFRIGWFFTRLSSRVFMQKLHEEDRLRRKVFWKAFNLYQVLMNRHNYRCANFASWLKKFFRKIEFTWIKGSLVFCVYGDVDYVCRGRFEGKAMGTGGGRFLLTKALLEPCIDLKATCIPIGVVAWLEICCTLAGGIILTQDLQSLQKRCGNALFLWNSLTDFELFLGSFAVFPRTLEQEQNKYSRYSFCTEMDVCMKVKTPLENLRGRLNRY